MNDIESKLKRLQPNAGALDRDQLIYSAAFAAGRAAGKKPWQRISAALALSIIALSFGWVFSSRLPPLPPHAIVPAELIAPAPPAAKPEPYQPEPTSYIALMQHMGEYRPTMVESFGEPPRPPLTPRSQIE